jgi:hypothetical protein
VFGTTQRGPYLTLLTEEVEILNIFGFSILGEFGKKIKNTTGKIILEYFVR